MRNPLNSSRDPLWWFVLLIGAALATVLTVLMPLVGVIWAALLLGFGAGRALHGSQPTSARPAKPTRSTDGGHRVLVLANEAAVGGPLWAEIESRCGNGRGGVLIVAPALVDSRAALWASDFDGAIEEAGRRLELSLRAAREAGLSAEGRIGDADPNAAIEDALHSFAADEIIIWTHTPDRSPWLERGVVQRAREELDLPITHVMAAPAAGAREPDH